MKYGKKFIIIGNQNAITYKEVFPLIKENKMWLGNGFRGGATHFISHYKDIATAGDHREGMIRVSGVVWFTNLEHGRRHQPLPLMTMEQNIKYSKHKEIRGKGYQKYDNYDAIEVPFSDAIPSDYEGVMGVPITFLDKYCPEQFKILGITSGRKEFDKISWSTKRYINPLQINENGSVTNGSKANTRATVLLNDLPNDIYYTADNAAGPLQIVYARILIQKTQ